LGESIELLEGHSSVSVFVEDAIGNSHRAFMLPFETTTRFGIALDHLFNWRFVGIPAVTLEEPYAFIGLRVTACKLKRC
jgi:hypothetical protein